jgi:hypothetical protein
VSGTVYCDANGDGAVSNGDTPLASVVARATSQTVNPGTHYTDATSSSGAYFIPLPDDPDGYVVGLTGLPGGSVVALPVGGTFTIELTATHVAESNVHFLVEGCDKPATTTSTSASTSTSSSTTTSTSAPASTTISTTSTSTSTSSSSSTSTTSSTQPACGCDAVPFITRAMSKYNNDAQVLGTIGVDGPNGTLRIGRNVFMADGTSARAHRVFVGNGSDVSTVHANHVQRGQAATIRDGTSAVTLPLVPEFCEVSSFGCGGPAVVVEGLDVATLPPGSYGALVLGSGTIAVLEPGEYFFCDVKLTRNATLRSAGEVTINVAGDLRIGNGSLVAPVAGTEPVPVNVLGNLVRVSQGATANVSLKAPNAKLSVGRDGTVLGCFCTATSKSDKHTFFSCTS